MTRITYNFDSLNRHEIGPPDIDEVMASGIWEEMPPSIHGNSRLMFIGFTSSGRLLEVGVEYFDYEDREHVFHTNDATSHHKQVFEKRIKT